MCVEVDIVQEKCTSWRSTTAAPSHQEGQVSVRRSPQGSTPQGTHRAAAGGTWSSRCSSTPHWQGSVTHRQQRGQYMTDEGQQPRCTHQHGVTHNYSMRGARARNVRARARAGGGRQMLHSAVGARGAQRPHASHAVRSWRTGGLEGLVERGDGRPWDVGACVVARGGRQGCRCALGGGGQGSTNERRVGGEDEHRAHGITDACKQGQTTSLGCGQHTASAQRDRHPMRRRQGWVTLVGHVQAYYTTSFHSEPGEHSQRES